MNTFHVQKFIKYFASTILLLHSGSTLAESNNHITISSGTTKGDIIAATSSSDATISNNSVKISGSSTVVDGSVVGGRSIGNGSLTENKVIITDGAHVTVNVFGGHTTNSRSKGTASENTVTISGSGTHVERSVYGANSYVGADNNKVFILDGATVGASGYTIVGGFTSSGSLANAEHNSVVVSGNGTTVTGYLIGGETQDSRGAGSANFNSVEVTSGAKTKGNIVGGSSKTQGDAANNTVKISGSGTVTTGDVMGGASAGSGLTTLNTVEISDGASIVGSVFGGAYSSSDGQGDYTFNSVSVSGERTSISSSLFGGKAKAGNANGNMVSIEDGSIGASVYGGFSDAGNASENSVSISGGLVQGDVVGGYANNGSATQNTVTIKGGSFMGNLFGGYKEADIGSTDLISGNNLELHSKLVLEAGKTAAYFESYNFFISPDIAAGDTMLTAGSAVDFQPVQGNQNNVQSKIKIASVSTDTQLVVGDKITLINKTENA
ncbi:hypothetical protein E1162_00090, partial [Rhodobacteraceae bacterium RKSG542]|uniref:hypothetical protein n=1 Tax=Pseudovibrio flavus TaxID=2529854 RepID=UPI0012BBA5A7